MEGKKVFERRTTFTRRYRRKDGGSARAIAGENGEGCGASHSNRKRYWQSKSKGKFDFLSELRIDDVLVCEEYLVSEGSKWKKGEWIRKTDVFFCGFLKKKYEQNVVC
jgi:hypothetical protein